MVWRSLDRYEPESVYLYPIIPSKRLSRSLLCSPIRPAVPATAIFVALESRNGLDVVIFLEKNMFCFQHLSSEVKPGAFRGRASVFSVCIFLYEIFDPLDNTADAKVGLQLLPKWTPPVFCLHTPGAFDCHDSVLSPPTPPPPPPGAGKTAMALLFRKEQPISEDDEAIAATAPPIPWPRLPCRASSPRASHRSEVVVGVPDPARLSSNTQPILMDENRAKRQKKDSEPLVPTCEVTSPRSHHHKYQR